MTKSELMSMTVLQLRKLARDQQIILGAGIDKNTMVHRILSALGESSAEEELPENASVSADPAESEEPLSASAEEEAAPSVPAEEGLEVPADSETAAEPFPDETAGTEAPMDLDEEESPLQKEASSQKDEPSFSTEPKYQAAWHSPDSPLYAPHSSHPAGSFSGVRPSRLNPVPTPRPMTGEGRIQPLRTNPQPHRFGPAVRREAAESPEVHPAESPAVRPAVSPLPDHRVGFAGNGAFSGRPASVYTAEPVPVSTPAAEAPASPAPADAASPSLTLEELLASGDFEEGGGILELHPDGYGFLRSSHFMPSSRDIYVSMAQIRRFGLRTGDMVFGKVRPQREGDKYAALLYIDTVNGIPEAEAFSRPVFEELTPVYPSRRISLEFKDGNSVPAMRLIDLIAPLGFGQRGLILCPPDTGKRELLRDYARVITTNFPEATVLMLMIDMNPEDVTLYRESVSCPVLASTFDQSPESHLRLTEMVMERAMRLVEQKKDVVILADSLTRLAKIYTTAAVQQGRSVPGMVNPASLLRAKKLFGAARACKEGGSLTVIAAMDVQTGSRVDDSVVEEFKGTANMELLLDQTVARAGISPAINLHRSYTKNSDLLLNARQKEGLALIREMLGTTSSAVAIPQLLSMMEKTATNSELLLKMKDWFALMNR